jgi:trehalose utilization protein
MKFFRLLLAVLFAARISFVLATGAPIRVTIWDEQQPAQKSVYTNFLGNHIAAHLKENAAFQVRSVHLDEPDHGLPEQTLNDTDVLIWWGHIRHADVPQALADRIVERVKAGKLALIALHSAHWSAPFRTAMEARLIQNRLEMLPASARTNATIEFMHPRKNVIASRAENPFFETHFEPQGNGNGSKWHVLLDRPSCVFPACCTPVQSSTIQTLLPDHPIAKGIPAQFTLSETEMYDEPFFVPEPDALIFREFWAGGEHFRSGMLWRVGKGNVFYFRPGHETYHVFTQPVTLHILDNACAFLGGEVQKSSHAE